MATPGTTTSTTKKTPRAPAKPDATRLLTQDHKEVDALFKAYDKLVKSEADGSERQPLAEQICLMLTVHTTIEEEIFYPAAKAAGVQLGLLDEAEVEHASAKELIAQIRAMTPDEDLYDAKVTVLGEYIRHHVKEEHDELFPQCRKAPMDLKELGAELAARKAELMSEMTEGQEASS